MLERSDNHRAEIKSGKVAYRIVGMPDHDSPRCQITARRRTSPSRRCAETIERTLFSICNDETLFHLDGVFFDTLPEMH